MFGDVNLKGYQAGLHGTISESRKHRVINLSFVPGLDKGWQLAEEESQVSKTDSGDVDFLFQNIVDFSTFDLTNTHLSP